MSSDIAIKVESIGKRYEIYDAPSARLKQFIVPSLKKIMGKESRDYFSEFWALRDISFEVKRGESVGILGRNGSGKSTLLQIICGTLRPTSGSVITKGRIAALLELGSGFNPDFTGRENVYLNGSLLGLDKKDIDEKFDEIAAFADIGDFIEQPVKTYSSGMMVRLAFAVQVQVDPDILVIDEALAVGDALFQKRCFQRIEKLVSDGTTLLFVSHDQESVRTLTSRALLLKSGRQIAWGNSPEVVMDYRRLLHNEESKYFSEVTSKLKAKAELKKANANESANTTAVTTSRAEKLSFGDGEATITDVKIFNDLEEEASVFYPNDGIKIRVGFKVDVDLDKLGVAIRIRNKEGVKIYSWGTLNQDMSAISRGDSNDIFWSRNFIAGERAFVEFTFNCSLGMNLYEVQATISYEETPDYLSQRILHWVDEAAFFQVVMRREQYFFGGVSDLRMNAIW